MNYILEITANNFIAIKITKLRSLLPQGEGQDEGIYKTAGYYIHLPPPHPNPLPEGEGVNGIAVGLILSIHLPFCLES
jgi:hypothetical protein